LKVIRIFVLIKQKSMPNKLWGQLYGLGTSAPTKEKEYRVRSGGSGFKKLEEQCKALGLDLCSSYNKWYNLFDETGSNVRYDAFDSLQDVKDWLKNDYEDWKKNGRG
jgi:hypothetical protein